MSTDPARVAGRQDHRRQNHRTELAQDITAAGGKTDAFLKELDTHQLYLDDLVDRFIAEKETEYIEFANSLRERYKYFIKRPLADIAKSKQHVSSEAVIEEHPGKSQGPDIEARPVDGSASGPTLTDESGVSNLDERMVPQIGPPPTPRSPAALDMAKSTESEPTSPIIEQKAALNQRRLSAIRNSTASTRTPRKKRVSLVVGDEVVAPSDVISRSSPAHDLPGGHPSHASILSSLRKYSGNAGSGRKTFPTKDLPRGTADKENAAYVDAYGPDSPFLMDEEALHMPVVLDDDVDKADREASSDELDTDERPTATELKLLSSSPALAIPRGPQFMSGSRRQTFSLQMQPTVPQPVTSGFSMPSAQFDPTGSPERFETAPARHDELMFGSLTRVEPGSFKSGSLGASMIGSQLQSIYLSKSKPV